MDHRARKYPQSASIQHSRNTISPRSNTHCYRYGCCGEELQGTKVMGAYKLFVGGEAVGIGPGRAECGAVAPGVCPHTTPYDGFDLTSRFRDATNAVDLVIHACVMFIFYQCRRPCVSRVRHVHFFLIFVYLTM